MLARLIFLACSACFLILSRATCPGMARPHSELSFLTITNQENVL